MASAAEGNALPSAEQKSYLGCEYYAVDLDNANVPCGRDELGNIRYCDAANSQFAVVSNPDPSVTVYGMVMDSPVDVPVSAPACGVFPSKVVTYRALRLRPWHCHS